MTVLSPYSHSGGIHPETAALANVLAAHGKPISETLLMGIMGGLGIGYILWEFQAHHTKVLVLAFHHRWQYPIEYYENACKRLGLQYRLVETGSKKAAAQALDTALTDGIPAIAWVDRASMPYLQLPEAMIGHFGHFVAVCGSDTDGYWIDDLAAQPYKIATNVFADARARIGSYKSRLLLIENAPAQIDLTTAIRQGINTQIDHLSSDSESFSLPAIRKWARTMTDGKNKKGWLKVFEDRRGLYSTLSSIFEGIALNGSPGGLRGIYSDFLRAAANMLGKPALNEAAAAYRALSEAWDALAQEALADAVAPFKRAKQLLCERHAILMQGGELWRSSAALTEQIRQIRSECNQHFPLNDAEVHDLFATLQKRLESIYSAEVAALNILKASMA